MGEQFSNWWAISYTTEAYSSTHFLAFESDDSGSRLVFGPPSFAGDTGSVFQSDEEPEGAPHNLRRLTDNFPQDYQYSLRMTFEMTASHEEYINTYSPQQDYREMIINVRIFETEQEYQCYTSSLEDCPELQENTPP